VDAPASEPDGRIAENIVYFARALREAGLPVGPASVIDAIAAVETAGIVSPRTARQQARQGNSDEAHVGAAGKAPPAQVIGTTQRGGDVPNAFKVGKRVDFQHTWM